MNYQNFKENIKHVIQNQLGSDVTVTIQEIIKNNNTHLDGLTILSDTLNISPTIYLNYYYRQYLKGKTMDEIYREILTVYRENTPRNNIDISFFTDYEKVKKRIVFKLINYDRNKALLDKIPYIRYLDLAIVFNCLVTSDANGSATILIYNHHLAFWNITKDDLYTLAMQNTPKLLTYDLRNMTDVLEELMSDAALESDITDIELPIPMYVLSNTCKLNGSSCILYKNLLPMLGKKLDSDFYILPSSIHEVLLIPAYEHNSEELTKMVREVNATQLANEEILSDHVYYFCRETGKLCM